MAMEPTQAPSSGIWAAIKGALGVFDDLNKSNFVSEERNPFPIGEFESDLDEHDIIELVDTWKQRYAPYYTAVEKSQRLAFKYWIGEHDTADVEQWQGSAPAVDNLIFESIETFLPIATRSNPDPLVSADPSAAGQALARDLKNALVHEADRQKLRILLKKVMRHWLIYRIGILKFTWDVTKNEIETCVVNPKRIIFDVDGFVDADASFKGEYFGEKIREPASKVLEKFDRFLDDEKRQYIMQKANHKMGTMLEYFEWWYHDTDVFYTLDDIVLGKFKNHMWNYDGEEERTDPDTGEVSVEEIKGRNFLPRPSSPYRFLSIFNTGIQPHDETSLIMQNIGIQDMINRRWRQIDKNVSRINNSLVVNGRAFSDEQASLAATAMRRGTAIRVPNPSGNNLAADVMNLPAPGLNESVYVNLQDARSELKNIFGIGGSTSQGVKSQETARGQILVNQLDASRIGGGITEFLEQLADATYNYWIQIMYVYYDTPHYISVAGLAGGEEMAVLQNVRFGLTQTLSVTVKEGSLVPKDPLTQRNEAVQLWGANGIDPRTMYSKLEWPDPNEAAKQLILWQLIQKGDMNALGMYMPDFQQIAQPSVQNPETGQTALGQQDQNVNPVGRPPTPESQRQDATMSGPVAQQSEQLMSSVKMPPL